MDVQELACDFAILYGTDFQWNQANIYSVPHATGVYALYSRRGALVYVGRAGPGRLQSRLLEHWREHRFRQIESFHWFQCARSRDSESLESLLILDFQPRWNVQKKGMPLIVADNEGRVLDQFFMPRGPITICY